MQLKDGRLIVSATDLVGFLACDHLSTLELGRVEGRWERPHRRSDPTVQLMQDRGDAHELAYLEQLRAGGFRVVEIDKDGLTGPAELAAAQEATLEAMRSGADIVFQATFFDGRWRGHADFLRRVERPSPLLGGWSYEVLDTKLSRGVKGSAVLQLCVYADLLEKLQGVAPEFVYVVTGDLREHEIRLAGVSAYYRRVRARFDQRVAAGVDGAVTYPDPVEHCHVCVWYPTCIQRRRDDDHPSIVAGIRRVDTERLLDDGVPTLAALGRLPTDRRVPDMSPRVLGRLRHQARLQLDGRRRGELIHELIEPDPEQPGRGLAALPEPSPWDVFLDIEADPWALDDGLEYLLGIVTQEAGEPRFLPLWGHDRAGEKAAFERLIDLVIERLEAHPEMHLYHYGGYESGAIKRLMQRHATREDEVDRLLRGGVLVDLLNVVRQGVRASVESYSLKSIEKFYLAAREGPVTEAGFSVVAYEDWLRTRDPARLQEIEDYNADDCRSTWLLRGWLEERRTEAVAAFPDADWTRPAPVDGAPSDGLAGRLAEVQARIDALTADVPADRAARTPEQQARWLLAALLDWHRRDDKPAWWNWHRLRSAGLEELVEATEALGGLEFEGDVEWRKRSVVRRYRFEPQDHKFRVGQRSVDPHGGDDDGYGEGAGEIVAIDDVAGTIDLLRGPSRLGRHPVALIPGTPIPAKAMQDALLRVADDVIEHGMNADGPYRAVRDLLLRRPPWAGGEAATDGEPLRRPDETPLEAAKRLALELDGGILAIQGPPGTGKTWTGARMIVELVRAGRRVGVAAQSHKAITNALRAMAEAAAEAGVPIRTIQKCDTGDEATGLPGVAVATDNDDVEAAITERRVDVVAGTAWLFSRAAFDRQLDVLLVDEAGQVSLANVVAMATAARSIVLLGDPNQLPMVTQGLHPEGAGASALEHVLGGETTVPEHVGLFLDTTYRMHPDVNAYVSEVFYGGRLEAVPETSRQVVGAGPGAGAGQIDGLAGAGLRFRAVDHDGNASRSREEAALVAEAVASLLGRPWTDAKGVTTPLGLDRILVVAPYNAQVAAIHAAVETRLGAPVRVGTVDKFQGQEGAVSIYSMTSSSQEDAPRDMEFLYSRNRLNVAVSRARSVAIVIANPRLLDARCRTPEQMRLLNALCRYVEVAEAQATNATGIAEPLTLGLV